MAPSRTLPLFLPTEGGGEERFVGRLVGRVECEGGGVEGPAHAARFVRLLPWREEVAVGGARRRVVHSLNALMARGGGGLEDHVFLLTSLLLGFGLDAYVASGVGEGGAPLMVTVTRQAGRVVLWDACTGTRHALSPRQHHKRVAHAAALPPPPPLQRVWAVWNDRRYFANVQLEDDVELVDWQLEGSGWAAMDEAAIALLPQRTPFPLQPCTVDPLASATQLEADLRRLISAYRRHTADLTTSWCPQLSYTLSPMLTAYEWERVIGEGAGEGRGEVLKDGAEGGGVGLMRRDFEAAVQHSTPDGGVFRAVPFQFGGLEPGEIMRVMLEERAFVATLEEGGVGGEVQLGVRVKVVPYCEEVMAVWVIVASTQTSLLIPSLSQR